MVVVIFVCLFFIVLVFDLTYSTDPVLLTVQPQLHFYVALCVFFSYLNDVSLKNFFLIFLCPDRQVRVDSCHLKTSVLKM